VFQIKVLTLYENPQAQATCAASGEGNGGVVGAACFLTAQCKYTATQQPSHLVQQQSQPVQYAKDAAAAAAAAEAAEASAAGAAAAAGSTVEAQPYFPVPLAKAKLLPASVEVTVTPSSTTPSSTTVTSTNEVSTNESSNSFTVKLVANTTCPFTFLSSTTPGVFSDNTFLLLPDEPREVEFVTSPAGILIPIL
jgi:hypothetical protein